MLDKFGSHGKNNYRRWQAAKTLLRSGKQRGRGKLGKLKTPKERSDKRYGAAAKLRKVNPAAARRLALSKRSR
jgi:hypothetical protein